MAELQAGFKHSERIIIDKTLLVPALPALFTGMEEMPPVFATAYLLASVEWTCIQGLKPYYQPGQRTVGTYADLKHIAATVAGMSVTVEVELVELKGKLMKFKVSARDDQEIIAEGFHGRAFIDLDKFMVNVEKKAARQQS
jgi:fluoroacetyl-CoA thioesterase